MGVPAPTLLSRRRVLSSVIAITMASLLAACTRKRSVPDVASGTSPLPSVIPETGIATTVVPSPTANAPGSSPLVGATLSPSASPPPMGTGEADRPPPAVVAWLRDHALPFVTAEPTDDFSDLQPLKQLIGDARIVALGEATHGTHEFQAMKHRLVRFLVSEMGFTDFAMEANLPESERINDYVQTGTGDLKQLLIGQHFWTWNTEEVRDMIDWMRMHNQSPGTAPRVRFQGFDLQYIDVAQGNVLAYLRRVDPPAAVAAAARFAYPGLYRPGQDSLALLPSAPTQTQTTYLANVQAIHDELLASRARYEAISTPGAFADALQDARIVVQGIDTILASARKHYDARDRYMAENVTWLLGRAGSDAKMILWAHNEHVGTLPYGDTTVAGMGIKSMGMWLRERYGVTMRVVGQTFYVGACNAVEGTVTEVAVPPPPPDSYEKAFHETGLSRLIVDLRGMQPGTIATDWLAGPHRLRLIGASYDEAAADKYFSSVPLPQKFDALISFENGTATQLLPFI